MFADLAALTPKIESSITTHFSGLVFSLGAAFKKICGSGFECEIDSAVRTASKYFSKPFAFSKWMITERLFIDARPIFNLPCNASRSSLAPGNSFTWFVSSISSWLLRSIKCWINFSSNCIFADRNVSRKVSAAPIPIRRSIYSLLTLQFISLRAFWNAITIACRVSARVPSQSKITASNMAGLASLSLVFL